jgi:hypothetical protein
MSRLPVPGEDTDIWGEVLNDFLSVAHLADGTLKPGAAPVADGSVTPAKLSQSYIATTEKGASSGVATLDGSGKVPVGQLPASAVAGDATTSSKGIIQLAGDLAGTAAAPTVPGLASKYVKPAGGIPETDLDSTVQTKLNASGTVGDATTSTKGVLQLAGDLGGTAASPTVPALSSKINSSEKGALNGVATLDGAGKVTASQLPAASDATTSAKGIIQLAGDLAGTAAAPTVPGLSSKASDAAVVHLSGTETITGAKTFSASPIVPAPSNGGDAANKTYVDNTIASASAPDATTSSKGIIQLAGDLGGTAAAPTVPGLAGKADKTTAISAGTGLTGGGDLSTNRSLAVSYGATAGTAAQGNDSRINGAEQVSNKGATNGYASLDGSGKVPASQLPATADATTSSKGIIQLAGDLAGTASAPTVPGLSAKISTSEKGAPNGVAVLNAQGRLTDTQTPPQLLPYTMSGVLYATVGAIRLYNYSGAAWTILGVSASAGTAPTGSSIITDVKISGTTIFTTQANRPTIAAGANASGHVTNMDVTTVANGAYLTVDVAQVGNTTPGADLCILVEVR